MYASTYTVVHTHIICVYVYMYTHACMYTCMHLHILPSATPASSARPLQVRQRICPWLINHPARLDIDYSRVYGTGGHPLCCNTQRAHAAPPRPHRPPQRRPPGRCRHRCIQPWPLPPRPPRARHTPSRAPVPSAGLAAVLLLLLLLARAAKITARAWCRPLHRPPPIRPPTPPQPRPPPPPPPRHHPRSRDRRRPMSRRTLTPHGGA